MSLQRATYTVQEVSELYGISRALVYIYVDLGVIPGQKVRGRYLFIKAVIDAHLAGKIDLTPKQFKPEFVQSRREKVA